MVILPRAREVLGIVEGLLERRLHANKINKIDIIHFEFALSPIKIDYRRILKQIHIQSKTMKQLTSKKPLCYMLENSHLVAALPFIDQELSNQIPKSKVAYIIRAEQEEMQKNQWDYIASLQEPELTYANSEAFQSEVARVQAKFEQKDKGKVEGKPKRKEISFTDPPKKLVSTEIKSVATTLHANIITYQNCLNKSINIDLYKKFGPLVLKELIEVLEKEKINLQTKIQCEKNSIQSLNQNRKYLQTQSYQREHDIEQRIKIMLNKRRKVE